MKTLFCALLVVLSLVVSSRAQADCKEEASIQQILDASKQAEKAFADMDLTSLLRHASMAREQLLPCVKQPFEPKSAAAFHRLMALEAFTRHDNVRVITEFHAARVLDPGYTIPADVADGDHPLLRFYEESAHAKDGRPEPVYAPAEGHVMVGGMQNAPRFKLIPAIVQVYSADSPETWIETRYIQPGEALPIWGKNVFGTTAKDLGIDMTPGYKKPLPWYITGGVSLLLSGVAYGLAMNEKSQYLDKSTPEGNLSGHKDRATGFGVASIALAGVGAALGTTGLILHLTFDDEGEIAIEPAMLVPPPLPEQMLRMGGFP